MSTLITTLENVLIDRVLSKDAPFTGKSKAGLGLFTLALAFLLIALAFFIYAAYLWMSKNYPPEVAATLMGGLILSLAAISGIVAYAILSYKRLRMKKLKNEIIETMQSAIELADEEISEPIKENPKTAVLIASLAGFVAGEKFL